MTAFGGIDGPGGPGGPGGPDDLGLTELDSALRARMRAGLPPTPDPHTTLAALTPRLHRARRTRRAGVALAGLVVIATIGGAAGALIAGGPAGRVEIPPAGPAPQIAPGPSRPDDGPARDDARPGPEPAPGATPTPTTVDPGGPSPTAGPAPAPSTSPSTGASTTTSTTRPSTTTTTRGDDRDDERDDD